MNWSLVWMAFGTLFMMEMGDKTQLAVFTLASQHKNALSIFVGASLGLTVVTALGAFLGGFISRYIPIPVIKAAAGLLFVGIGAVTLVQTVPELTAFFRR